MDLTEIRSHDNENRPGEDVGAEKHEHRDRIVTVLVNDHPVKLLGHSATAWEIKTAAIEQGVPIHLDFVLEENPADGPRRAVGDHEQVPLRDDLRFTAHAKKHTVTVTVNEQPVKLDGHRATGAEIEAAAITQGVRIQQNFVLQEELPNGTSRIVGATDEVHLREHLRFTAIAPDDNS
jgi:hypothetical protein